MIVKMENKEDVEWLQMGMWFRPAETNGNVCRQTGLRGADRREMVSTCYMAGPPLLFTLQLHDTHRHGSTHQCVCLLQFSALSRGLHTRGRERGGCPLFSLPLLLSSSILLLSHTHIPSSLSFLSSLPRYLSGWSLLFSLHLSSSQHMLFPQPTYLSGCLSASASTLLISPLGGKTLLPPAATAHPHGHAIFSFFWINS